MTTVHHLFIVDLHFINLYILVTSRPPPLLLQLYLIDNVNRPFDMHRSAIIADKLLVAVHQLHSITVDILTHTDTQTLTLADCIHQQQRDYLQ